MNKNKYYGTNDNSSVSYLEYGSINLSNSSKQVWDFRLHDKAYDWLMHARYSNDIYAYLKMNEFIGLNKLEESLDLYNLEIHHKDDGLVNLNKLIATITSNKYKKQKTLSFFELGQTLFGCIDGMEFSKNLLNHLEIDFNEINLKNIEWKGVDISDFFNRMSKVMHSNYNIETFNEISGIQSIPEIFFAKGVTLLYACDNILSLYEVIDKGRISLFDYSFSLDGEKKIVIGTGKQVRYLDINNFLKILPSKDKTFYINKNNSFLDEKNKRIWIDCIYAENDLADNFILNEHKIKKQLFKKLSNVKKAKRLLSNNDLSEWIPLDKFINSL